jgi:hypothetical protein
VKRLFGHPVTRRTRRIARRVVVTCAVILAVMFVTTLSVDLGPALRGRAEAAATQYMERPMHIGRLSVHLWRGQFVVEDLVIEGLTPESTPFLLADRIAISMPWSTLISRRVVFDAIEMRGWRMPMAMATLGTAGRDSLLVLPSPHPPATSFRSRPRRSTICRASSTRPRPATPSRLRRAPTRGAV